MSKLAPRKIVPGLPLLKLLTEVSEIGRDLFVIVGGIGSQMLDVLEEIRAEECKQTKLLERMAGVFPQEGEDSSDELDELAH